MIHDSSLLVFGFKGALATYTLMIEKSADGYYVEMPGISGVYAEGNTETEVMANIKDVFELTLQDMRARGEAFPVPTAFPSISFSAISVTI